MLLMILVRIYLKVNEKFLLEKSSMQIPIRLSLVDRTQMTAAIPVMRTMMLAHQTIISLNIAERDVRASGP